MNGNVHYATSYTDERGRYNGRTIAETFNEVKQEFKQFAETRIAMLCLEIREKIQMIKISAPLLVAGALIALTAFFALTAALVSLLYVAFAGSSYAIFLACLIVGVIYAIMSGVLLLFGYRTVSKMGLIPDRTIRTLKEDKVWLQNEARSKL